MPLILNFMTSNSLKILEGHFCQISYPESSGQRDAANFRREVLKF